MNSLAINDLNPLFNLAPLVIALPLLGVITNLMFGRKMSEKGIGLLASSAAGGSFLISVLLTHRLDNAS